MLVRSRLVAAVLLAVAGTGCALLDGGSETADCEAVRVAFEDALGHVRATDTEATDEAEVEYGGAAMRDAVQLHDARQECFDGQHQDFLDPARPGIEEDQEQPRDFLGPVGEEPALGEPAPPGMLGDPAGQAGTD